ncbi:hypothetical protein SD72_06570 [Leucobacter komagatae]|uniref:Big-1 domain-containing protein n=1 Tax=Leucobacter komagatae TaxID=55969 RepID=A0A0D0IMP7_9MICO|nr:hypothetical protein SD72_06570 [Leucobacter komagatae]
MTIEGEAPPRRGLAALATKSLAVGLAGLLTVGAAMVGTATAAQAADPIRTGTVALGKITATNSPIDLVVLDSSTGSQLGSPAFGTRAYFPGGNASTPFNTGATLVNSANADLMPVATGAVQKFGGTGTSQDPFWISSTLSNAATTVTKRDSYVLGANAIRTDLTYTNRSASPVIAQLGYWVDSMFAGSDKGTNRFDSNSVSSLGTGTTATSSFVGVSPGAQFSGGEYQGVRKTAKKFGGLKNECVGEAGLPASCQTVVDNGMAIGWVLPEVAPAASVTRTYFASFSADLKIADIGASSAVSVATAEVGDTFEYTLTVDNEIGPDIADAVTVEFPLPAGVTLKSQSGTGTYDPQTGRWAAGDIALKGAASITLTVEATGVGTQTAQILYASPKLAIDMTPVDATSTETNVVEVSDRFDASQSQIAATPTTLAADGQAESTITVSTFGATGAPMTVGGATVTIASTIGTPSAVRDNGDGTYTATLSSTASGNAIVSATVDGVDISGPTVTFTPGAPDGGENASTLVVTGGNKTADGETAHTATITLKDANGNLIPGAAERVAATADPETGVTISAFSEVTPGVYEATVVSTVSGVKQITATADTKTHLGTGSAAFVAGAISMKNSSLALSTGKKIADGVDAHTATVTLKDAHGNSVANATVNFSVAGQPAAGGGVLTDENGEATLPITSTEAGLVAVSATVEGAPIPGAGNVEFIAGAANASASVFSVSPGSVLANGEATHTATATAKDAFGNPIAGVAVDFTVPANVSASTPAVTDEFGATQVTLTSTVAGRYAIGAEIAGDTISGAPQDVEFAPGAADASQSSWTVTPDGPVAADGTSAYTVVLTARDSNGNAVPNATFSVDVPAAVTPNLVDWVTGADGTATGTFTSVKAGSYPASVTLGGDAVGVAKELVFNAGAVSTSTSTIESDVTKIKADGTTEATITVTLKDANGNLIDSTPLPAVAIETSEGALSDVTSNGDGTFTATLTATAAGAATLSFTIDGASAVDTTAVELINAVPPAAPVVNPTSGAKATGTAQPGSTVTVRNDDGIVIGTGSAGLDGSFTIALSPQPAHETVISVTATDADDNVSDATDVMVDSIAPAAPVVNPSNGERVSGQAEPGATVVIRDEDGTVLGSGKADEEGNFAFPLSPAAADGAELSATAVDAAGNVSDATLVTVDAVAPTAPVVDPTDGSSVTGKTEPGAEVIVKDADGNVIGEGVADEDGNFVVDLSPVPGNGDEISVVVKDPAGNESDPTVVVVDSAAPDAPIVNPTDGTQVSGQAEPGATVVVRDSEGTIVGSGKADEDGNFAFPISPAAADGAELSVTAKDAAGNVSDPTNVVVDASAPDAPTVHPSSGKIVTGSAEPGATVTIRNEAGVTIGTGVAGTDGAFSIALKPAAQTGDMVTATATDAADNESDPVVVPVNSDTPAPPKVNPTDGKIVSGTSEPNMTITVTGADGTVIGTGVAGADGKFSITLERAGAEGERLTVVATNEAGTDSAPVTVTVDSIAPLAPTLDPTLGKIVTGHAEPGSTVTVYDAAGNIIGTGVAGTDGSFSITLTVEQPAGAKLFVTATDANGNESETARSPCSPRQCRNRTCSSTQLLRRSRPPVDRCSPPERSPASCSCSQPECWRCASVAVRTPVQK